MKYSSTLIVVVLLIAVFALPVAAERNLYISTEGNDAWSGTQKVANPDATDGPLASLQGARDAIRTLKSKAGSGEGGIIVNVAPGIYTQSEAVTFMAEDSGASNYPIIYTGDPEGRTRILGAQLLNDFKPVTDESTLRLMDEVAREEVVQVDLKALGITDYGSPKGNGMALYFGGEPMALSRWPNEGFVNVVDVSDYDGHVTHGRKGSKTGKFIYDDERPARWVNEKDPWVHGYWFWDWSDERQPIANIDTENKTLTLAEPYHNYGYRKGQWYYAYNLLSELDTPGEWYIDRDTGLLYFWPPEPVDENECLVSISSSILKLADVSHMTFSNLHFEGTRHTAITMQGGTENRVSDCTFHNMGASAVSIANGTKHGVTGCEIYNMGGGGIHINAGDRTTLTPAGNFADNNHIHHFGQVKRVYQAAISLNGVGNSAAHNHIHDAPHMAIGFGGNDQLMEYNEIHDVCLESNDAGAIYTGRNWTMRGNVVRYNYMYDINGFRDEGCVGVYLDDMFSSCEIYGNLFVNVYRAAFIGGGRDCTVENNIFVNCKRGLHIDARALGWAHGHSDEWIAEQKEKGTISGIAYDKPPYSDRYPILSDIMKGEPAAPEGNRITTNIAIGEPWEDIEEKARPYLHIENNLVDVDPLFVDAANGDYRLKEDSPAHKIGFKPLPYDKMGLLKKE